MQRSRCPAAEQRRLPNFRWSGRAGGAVPNSLFVSARRSPHSLGVLEMLLEIRNVHQEPGEPPRRWWFSHEQDLLVWFGDDGTPVAFQLAYGKYRDEHAIRWKVNSGFSHYRVDDGETTAFGFGAPLLMAGGDFDAPQVLKRFRELSAEMPRDIADFVAARLREHPEYYEDTSPIAPNGPNAGG